MVKNLDRSGQPINKNFNALRRQDRAIDELIGVSKGMIADGVVNKAEAQFLADWLYANDEILDKWPANILYDRLFEMSKDGIFDEEEKKELFVLLNQSVGGPASHKEIANFSSSLPLDNPAPEVIFQDRLFCLTGKFCCGSRKKCEEAVIERGGDVHKTVIMNLNYLVVGSIGSADWIHSSHGRKIEKAMEYRNNGMSLAIISEEHWAGQM